MKKIVFTQKEVEAARSYYPPCQGVLFHPTHKSTCYWQLWHLDNHRSLVTIRSEKFDVTNYIEVVEQEDVIEINYHSDSGSFYLFSHLSFMPEFNKLLVYFDYDKVFGIVVF